MVVTEVRIKLMPGSRHPNRERLLGFCSITFDDTFVVRDLKIIEGTKGWFVAMPSRKLTDRCPECGFKNHLRARFCNHCGLALDEDRAARPMEVRAKLHADVAHPIHAQGRDLIQKAILQAYQEERERAQRPGYVCRYDEIDAGDYEEYDVAAYRVHVAHPRSGSHGEHREEAGRAFGAGIMER